MMFFFKKSEIHLDCFTSNQRAYELFKIDYAYRFYPEWWKNLPKSTMVDDNFYPQPTMKTCAGFINHYKNGLMVCMWSDLAIQTDKRGESNYRWRFADESSLANYHMPGQMDGYMNTDEYSHLKIASPWYFECKENIQWMVIEPTWHEHTTDFIVMPGTVDYKYQNATEINILIKHMPERRSFLIEAGRPMMHIIPLSEKKLIIHNHLLTNEEYVNKRKRIDRFKFINEHNTVKRMNMKCPFRGK